VAEHKLTHEKVAIKTMDYEKLLMQKMQKKTEREVNILLVLRHPHLVRVYEAALKDKQLHVIMEYVPGGELFDIIANQGKIFEGTARVYFQKLISGIEYCHNHKIAHRDLKPENILLDENKNIKIADFGLSNVMKDGRFLFTSCGSPNYAAPEVVSGNKYCGAEVDIWSIGVILFAMLAARLPFDDNHLPALFNKIKTGRYTMPIFISPEAQDLIRRMIEVDINKRITIPEIKHHVWYRTSLPFYISIMDNTKSKIFRAIDHEILNKLAEVTLLFLDSISM